MTPTERFTDNEERHHEARQRIESEYRFTDWLKIQLDGDSKLRADHDSAKEDARQRRMDKIQILEQQLERLKELAILSDASGLDMCEEFEMWQLINRSTGTWVV